MRSLAVIILFIMTVGCRIQKIPLTECDHESKWCKEIRVLASHSWKYAQLCKNVYNKNFTYKIDSYFDELRNFENKSISFYARLYREKTNNRLILVFRGTDSIRDFLTGNNPFYQAQNNYGQLIFNNIKNQYPNHQITVAGHSLGGAIAINISLNNENVIAYSFNGSPVFKNRLNFENTRFSIVEYGEVLKIPRIFGREATQEYTSIGCSRGNPVSQHDMQKLATCLTRIARFEDSEALNSLNINGIPIED